ncbi:MAG TPA: PGPGW domain-containing protein [Candidatus Acidoferrales bacterium]|nr:PGPGW domain-containing protein [Candidatus Acidoferrales bacterium]
MPILWVSAMNGDGLLIKTLQQAKRFLKILFGFTLLALGIVMIVTPGPGWLTILLALGVLAAEFVWARRLLDRLKEHGMKIRGVFLTRQPANRA